jgi:hypothetical protein
MKHNPDDTIAFCAADARKDLRLVGICKRRLAGARLTGLLRGNGVNPVGWAIEFTITIPRDKKVIDHVRSRLYARASARYETYIDNRTSLLGEAWGVLVAYDMSREEAGKLMACVRADMDSFLAARAAVRLEERA